MKATQVIFTINDSSFPFNSQRRLQLRLRFRPRLENHVSNACSINWLLIKTLPKIYAQKNLMRQLVPPVLK